MVEGWGRRVESSAFRDSGLGIMAWNLWLYALELRSLVLRFRIDGQGLGLVVKGLRFGIYG